MKQKPTVIVITGPTASGKTGVGVLLAKKLSSQVISADSMQIYKELDIATAKVTEKEAEGIKHHLIDIVSFGDEFSVAEYKKLCYEKIDEIIKVGQVPIIVGGTGLYVNSVIYNMNFEEEFELDKKLKLEYDNMEKNFTTQELFDYLNRVDEITANKIDKGNRKRILRAIKMSMIGNKKSEADTKQNLWQTNESKFNFLVAYIDMPRDLLYDRINKRVDIMISDGLIDEAKKVYDTKDKLSKTLYQAIGYKELFPYFEDEKSLEECIEILKQKTRNYAKRQVTWFGKISDKLVVNGADTKEEIVSKILEEYYEKSKRK